MRESSRQTDSSRSIGRRSFLTASAAATSSSLGGCVSSPDADESAANDTDAAPSDASGQTSAATEESDPLLDHPASIEVSERSVLDRRIEPTIGGLEAGQQITLTARTRHPTTDDAWRSRVTLEADEEGSIDLERATPIAGSYERADPMGPIWSMAPDSQPEETAFEHATHEVTFELRGAADEAVDEAADEAVDGAVDRDGTAPASETENESERLDESPVLARATTTRTGGSVETEPLGDDLVGTLHRPDGDGAGPGVLVLHGSGGQELEHVARLLASRGYVAASLQYFGDPEPIPSTLAEVPVEYVQRAIDAIAAHDRTTGDEVGVYGASKGGELALLAGAHLEGVGAVVSVAGSAYVWEGLTQQWRPAGTSSWSLDGEPVDAVSFPSPSDAGAVDTIRETYELALEEADQSTVEAATIPVEAIDGPCLLVSGDRDEMWPSTPYAEAVIDRLEDLETDVDARHLQFEDAGHAIGPPYVPTVGQSSMGWVELGGTPAGNARAAAEHWSATLEQLEGSLAED